MITSKEQIRISCRVLSAGIFPTLSSKDREISKSRRRKIRGSIGVLNAGLPLHLPVQNNIQNMRRSLISDFDFALSLRARTDSLVLCCKCFQCRLFLKVYLLQETYHTNV